MTALGKSLVFNFKYHPEMNRLYWKNQKYDDIPDPEIDRMVKRVGDQCREEAREFLIECGKKISEHFNKIAKCSVPHFDEKKWTVSCGLWPFNKKRPHNENWKLKAGAVIPKSRPELILWIWSAGEQQGREMLLQRFESAVSDRDPIDHLPDAVALARIPLFATEVAGFDVDREPFIEQVRLTIEKISGTQVSSADEWIRANK
jgi:hypothetical protein